MIRISPLLISVILLSACSLTFEDTSAPLPSTASTTSTFPLVAPTIVSTIPTRDLDQPWQVVPSPDGRYIARMYEGYWRSYSFQVIEVEDSQSGMIWALPSNGFIQRGDPHAILSFIGWSPDSTCLYFYYAWGYDGSYSMFGSYDLQEFNVQTGDLITLVDGLVAFSFFPDMSKFVYASEGRIGIHDLSTGDDQNVAIRSDHVEYAGNFRLSPSGSALVFTVMEDNQANATFLYMDTSSMRQVILAEAILEDFPFNGWTETESPRYLRIHSESAEPWIEVVVFDLDMMEWIILGTPTPHP